MRMGTAETLAKFRVAGFDRMFVLGTSRRESITIYSQQLRALVLAAALADTDLMPASIAIVGGGIGGLMVARALAMLLPTATITIVERRASLLHLLVGCRTRWLHPTINQWPRPQRPRLLPFFGWEAEGGFAHDIAKRWLKEWNEFVSRTSRIRVILETHLRGTPQEHSGKVYLDAPRLGVAGFDIAILAVGFGIESQFHGAEDSPSYWAVDPLEQEHVRAGASARRILISGVGDGGLIDFARARLRAFDHRGTLAEFVDLYGKDLVARLSDPEANDPGIFALRCRRIPKNTADEKLTAWLAKQLRSDTEVTLVGHSVLPFAMPSAPINRVLALKILELDKAGSSFVSGRLAQVAREGDRFVAKISTAAAPMSFDTVIIRHGADSAIRRDFPDIAELHDRVIADTGSELLDATIDEALNRLSEARTSAELPATPPAIELRIRRMAKRVGWSPLGHFDVARTVRRLHHNADWANPVGVIDIGDPEIAGALADTLEEHVSTATGGEADVRRLQHVVRLLARAGKARRAIEVFYKRVRGDEQRSLYEFGLYEEDRAALGDLLALWSKDDLERSKLLNSAGFIETALNNLDEAVKLLQRATIWRTKHARLLEAATSRINLADAYFVQGDSSRARHHIGQARNELARTSHIGLYRHALGRFLAPDSGAAEVEDVATTVFRLPESAAGNAYEHVLANICDVRVFAARILVASNSHREAIANEALRYLGAEGPGHRAHYTRFDRAVVRFFVAWLRTRFHDAKQGLGEALWEVSGTGDRVWALRCEMAAHLISDRFPAPAEAPLGLTVAAQRDASACFIS